MLAPPRIGNVKLLLLTRQYTKPLKKTKHYIGETKKGAQNRPSTLVWWFPQKKGGYEAINEEMLDSVKRDITTDASLDAAQDSDNITKTQFMATLNEPHPQGEGSKVLDLKKEKDAQVGDPQLNKESEIRR
ncbi:hypothetical protein Tco_1154585 [Tanacetum coccineum]